MAPTPLTDRVRNRLLLLLEDDRPVAGAILFRIRRIRDREGVPAFSAVVRHLLHLDLSDLEAEVLLQKVLRHRNRLREALRRDPGVRVSIADYLEGVGRQAWHGRITQDSVLDPKEGSGLAAGPNRPLLLEESLKREVHRCLRYRRSFSLLLVGVDRSGAIRETCGLLFHELLLHGVGRIVRSQIRDSDTGCGFASGKFAVVLPETGRQGAVAIGERIRQGVLRAFSGSPIHGSDRELTVSGSVCCHPEDGATPESILTRAQEALGLAQRVGNRILSYPGERRRFARSPAHPSLRAWIGVPPDRVGQPARPCDLSRGGVLLETHGDFPGPGTILVRFEADDDQERRWASNGRLVRVERVPTDARSHRIAIEFEPAAAVSWLEHHGPDRGTH